MSPGAKSLLLLCGTMMAYPATVAADDGASPDAVEIFTTSEIAVEFGAADAPIFEVDALAGLLEELGHGLPAEAEAARRVALTRISEIDDVWRAKAEEAVESLRRAQSYGLTKLPAVVFDHGRSVVYGTTDLEAARDIYRRQSQ